MVKKIIFYRWVLRSPRENFKMHVNDTRSQFVWNEVTIDVG